MNTLKNFPELEKHWCSQENETKGYFFDTTKSGSSFKATWKCDLGHKWEATVYSRAKENKGCPYCSGSKILKGFNDLSTTHPKIAKEWHPTKNLYLSVYDVSKGSKKKVWWLGACGHEWEMIIKNKVSFDRGCVYCKGKKTLAGFNDLSTTHPEIIEYWNFPRNTSVSIQSVSKGSDQVVWWVCNKGHEWEARVSSYVSGKRCPYCSGQKVLVSFNGFSNPFLLKEWNYFKNVLPPESFTEGSNKKVWWICDKGHEWEARICDRTLQNKGCKNCVNATSMKETELQSWLQKQIPIISNSRSILRSKELDIFVPSKNIAIEFNGLYWHNEKHKNKEYHYDKWKECKNKNIQLIQIWEDDYKNKTELVHRMLMHKLGLNEKRIYARKTFIQEISQKEATSFLNENHIQGSISGSIRVGLFDVEKQLVSVALFKNEKEKTLSLIRFATSQSVVGGFTKILNYVEKKFKPSSIITFSDNTVSDGGLYENNGFIAAKELKPDYMYVVKGKRVHKFNYRLKRFREDPALQFEEGLSERQLAILNNIPRVWDAGKIKWVKKLTYDKEYVNILV